MNDLDIYKHKRKTFLCRIITQNQDNIKEKLYSYIYIYIYEEYQIVSSPIWEWIVFIWSTIMRLFNEHW